MILEPSELKALLYEATLAGKTTTTIKNAEYRQNLLDVPLNGKPPSLAAREADFELSRSRLQNEASAWKDEFPGWTDLRDAAQASGLILPNNANDVSHRLNDLIEDAHKGTDPKHLYLALDTNTLFTRFARVGLPRLGIDARQFRYLTTYVVEDEVARRVTKKIEARHGTTVPRALKDLIGQPALRARLAKSAQGELRWLKTHRQGITVGERVDEPDKEQRDRLIARHYGAFMSKHRARVVLLTHDRDMADHAEHEDLEHIHLETPDLKSRATFPDAGLDAACRFAGETALRFGTVSWKPLGLTLEGAWRGKTGTEWNNGALRLHFEHDALRTELERTVTLVRNVQRIVGTKAGP